MILANMQLDRLGSLLVARPLLNSSLFRSEPAIPILMYHSISDRPERGVQPYYRLVTSPTRFREQMEWLKHREYVVIDLIEALHRIETGTNAGKRAVVITFDDGREDFLTHAWPVLVEFGFTATVFLPTAYIGTDRKSFMGYPCLTWDEVRELRACGVSFGAHTVSHPVLHGLPWSEIAREIGDSRERLEDQLQERVRTFAYPFAFPQEDRQFVTRLRRELVALGFTGAVTTAIGRARPGDDPLCLKRLPVNDCDDRYLFMSKLMGAYDWVGSVQFVSRAAKTLRG